MDVPTSPAVASAEDWTAAPVRPAPGAGTLARLGRVVLLVASTDPVRVRPLLEQAEMVAANGGQGRQLVRGYALQLSTSAEDQPAFVAMAPHDTGMAIIVQGDASVTVDGETISGADSLAWVERLVPWPVRELRASVDGAGAVANDLLRLTDGVVAAGGFVLGTPAPGPAEPAAPVAEPAAPVAPVAEPAAPVAEPAAPVAPVAEPAAPVAEPAAPVAPVAEPAAPVAEPVETPAPAPPPPPYVDPAETPAGGVPAPPPPPAPGPAAADRPAPALPADEVGGFDSVLLRDVEEDEAPEPLPIVSGAEDVSARSVLADPAVQEEEVRGVFCKNRHFNDPRQLFCAVCGINMVQQTPVLVSGTRPPLGVIVLDDGAVFQLDSDYLLGRDPSADERVRGGEVRGITVQDQSNQISRVHARIELRGWDVVLIDNQSTNGTFLNPPKSADWHRLSSGGEHVLTQGTRVRIGHRTLAFNTHAGQ